MLDRFPLNSMVPVSTLVKVSLEDLEVNLYSEEELVL